jgi:Calcineurin-like phosphoesterase
MRIQLLSDLHLESETFEPEPAPGADLLILAGDIDSTWAALQRFAGWPAPVLLVAGNHEFDGRDLNLAWPALRERCAHLGLTLLERESLIWPEPAGRKVRILATTRWSDFDLFGAAQAERAMRAGEYFMRVMNAQRSGLPFDVQAVREEALLCRAWLAQQLALPARGAWDSTVVVTHFAPSIRSADPRFGPQPGTASFCNADEDLILKADLWLHGHVHCRHDYRVTGAGGHSSRVVCQSRGLERKGEARGYRPLMLIDA